MKLIKNSPKFLAIKPSRLIFDPDVRGPRVRKEVIKAPPNFEHRDSMNGKFISYNTDQAIQWASQFPSLQLKFAEIAYRRIDYIEATLWFDQPLSAAKRNQLKFELAQLESDIHPIWENAIQSTKQYVGRLISSTVRTWMNDPVDFSEAPFFMPDWETYPYSNYAATSYLESLSAETRSALQISLDKYIHVDTKQEFYFYKLDQSIRNANKQSRLLGLNIEFEAF
jgi:hypothetical protein